MPVPRTIALAVLAAGITTAQAACASAGTPPTATSAPAAPAAVSRSATASPSATEALGEGPSGVSGGVLGGRRQVVIAPIPGGESILAVDAEGRLNPADGDVDKGLFVLTPTAGRYQIRTAEAEAGGEPSCLGVRQNGSDPLTVVATACDASRAGQLFTIKPEKSRDGKGRPTYAISNQGAFLQVAGGHGLIAEELGDSPLRTTYSFVDNGPSTLPPLD